MAKGYSLDFNGFLDMAEEIDKLGEGLLLDATKAALEESARVANIEIGKAMKQSPFNFTSGKGYSLGRARESLIDVSKMTTDVVGTVVTAYAGVDLEKAPEVLILAVHGSPHQSKDTNLYNAIKGKGKQGKLYHNRQETIFTEKLKEALNK